MPKKGKDVIAFREVEGKDGLTLYARFWIEEKTADGTFATRRIERSTGVGDPGKALRIAERLRKEARQKAYAQPHQLKDRDETQFAAATLSYIKSGGDHRFLMPILDEIGLQCVADIDQERMEQIAEKIYPGRSAATINRQIFTPIIAILRHHNPNQTMPFKRPKDWMPQLNFRCPQSDWWQRVLPECKPNLAAILLFWCIHGRSQSEATALEPKHLDRQSWQIQVQDTKVGEPVTFRLADAVIEQLNLYPWWAGERIFRFQSRWSVYKPLRKACERAGVPYHVPKDVGSHMMAINAS